MAKSVSILYYNVEMRNKTSEINRKICLKIKLERVKRGLSQEQLAELSSLSINTIGRIERSQISPSIDTIVQIADAFQLEFLNLVNTEGL